MRILWQGCPVFKVWVVPGHKVLFSPGHSLAAINLKGFVVVVLTLSSKSNS